MNKRCLILSITVLLVTCLPGLVVCRDTTPENARTDSIQLWGDGYAYLLGVNYPWLHYAHDFGNTAWGHDGVSADASKTEVDADFAYLKSQRVHVVRWFVFGDCRASPEFDPNGTVTGFDEHFYLDLDAALAIAQKHDIYLIPVLFDFHLADAIKNDNGVQLGGRSALITDPRVRRSFLDKALMPLLERYGKNRHIIAWDVINEPEGAMAIPGGKWVAESVSAEVMQSFVKEVVACIHAHSSQHATLGSAARQWLPYWKDSKLDFYQFHYYDNRESQSPLDYPYADLKLDKPCIVGEFPTKSTKRTMTQYLDTIWNNGYAGALAWSYRGNDEASDFRNVSDECAVWAKKRSSEIEIRQWP